jgi:hypothetical protein
VFGAGRYRPESPDGRRLLAHELAHVAAPAPGLLQRYEAPEHQDFGDPDELIKFIKDPKNAEWAKKLGAPDAQKSLLKDPKASGPGLKAGGGTPITTGDAIALVGDFYASPQALAAAPKEEVTELLDAIRRERAGELKGGKSNEEYERITLKHRKDPKKTFGALAEINAPHFAPGNRASWIDLHKQAIAKARQVDIVPRAIDSALLLDAGGAHYLTDAFAAGHLFDSPKIDQMVQVHLARRAAEPQNRELKTFYGIIGATGNMHKLVRKALHDWFNVNGVEVSNKRGMTWRTYGDDHLKLAPETLMIGQFAVYVSRQQVMQAAKRGAPEPDFNEVLDLLPDEKTVERVTQMAIDHIPEAIKDAEQLLYRQRGIGSLLLSEKLLGGPLGPLQPAANFLLRSNLETIASPGREKQILQYKEDEKKFGPMVPPQFTIFSR